MANTIALTTKYLPMLDEVYKKAATSSILDAPSVLVQETKNAKEIKIAKLALDGAADYDRNGGFVKGDIDLSWETHEFTHDRGRSFSVDAMDDLEALSLVAANAMSTFLREKVVPEIDAVRFSQYATAAGTKATGTLDATTVKAALRTARTTMEEAEVSMESVVCFMTPTVLGYLEDALNRSIPNAEGNIDGRVRSWDGLTIITVPQTRFNTEVTLNDGTTFGQEAGGFVASGEDINFLLVDRRAVLQITKHAKIREFAPDVNQNADAWKLDYRIYHDGWALENKVKGIYLHAKAAA